MTVMWLDRTGSASIDIYCTWVEFWVRNNVFCLYFALLILLKSLISPQKFLLIFTNVVLYDPMESACIDVNYPKIITHLFGALYQILHAYHYLQQHQHQHQCQHQHLHQHHCSFVQVISATCLVTAALEAATSSNDNIVMPLGAAVSLLSLARTSLH